VSADLLAQREYRAFRSHVLRPRPASLPDLEELRMAGVALMAWLPLTTAARIACRLAHDYLPVFRGYTRKIEAVERAMTALGCALGVEADRSAHDLREMLRDTLLDRQSIPAYRQQRQFVQAIESLQHALTGDLERPDSREGNIEWAIWGCIRQRELNVFWADDSGGARAEDEHWVVEEWFLLEADPARREAYHRRLLALQDSLRGRNIDENAAARAVAGREWRKVLRYVTGEVRRLETTAGSGPREGI
jgi:hypothetical protein